MWKWQWEWKTDAENDDADMFVSEKWHITTSMIVMRPMRIESELFWMMYGMVLVCTLKRLLVHLSHWFVVAVDKPLHVPLFSCAHISRYCHSILFTRNAIFNVLVVGSLKLHNFYVSRSILSFIHSFILPIHFSLARVLFCCWRRSHFLFQWV